MAVPALVYLAVAGTDMPLQRGWAIPAATDIAFAVGVLGLLGKRVPSSLRLFLLTVAIVDDLGADSLDTVELVMALEEEFETEIPDEDAEKITTVQQAIDYINERRSQA